MEKVSRLVSCKPGKRFFTVPMVFMVQCLVPFCFGKRMPENVNKSATLELMAGNICDKIMTTDIDYRVARKFLSNLDPPAKARIAHYTKLNTVLWYTDILSS